MSLKRRVQSLEQLQPVEVPPGCCSQCGGRIRRIPYARQLQDGRYELDGGEIVPQLPQREPGDCSCGRISAVVVRGVSRDDAEQAASKEPWRIVAGGQPYGGPIE